MKNLNISLKEYKQQNEKRELIFLKGLINHLNQNHKKIIDIFIKYELDEAVFWDNFFLNKKPELDDIIDYEFHHLREDIAIKIYNLFANEYSLLNDFENFNPLNQKAKDLHLSYYKDNLYKLEWFMYDKNFDTTIN
tara:strand:- start:465 stop:872 length:408 start_codon:yes stop_codon:yes gene_type:complete